MVSGQKTINDENLVDIFKALSNPTRLKIVQMLKEPEKYFPSQKHIQSASEFPGGICVSDIRDKEEISRSTTSQYLSLLQQSGVLEMKRIGQWTYYRRNEPLIKQLEDFISEGL